MVLSSLQVQHESLTPPLRTKGYNIVPENALSTLAKCDKPYVQKGLDPKPETQTTYPNYKIRPINFIIRILLFTNHSHPCL